MAPFALLALLALFGRSWALLGRSWGALGALLALLGRSWDALGRSWGALGTLGALLGRSWRSWVALGALLALLGRSWGALGVLFPKPFVGAVARFLSWRSWSNFASGGSPKRFRALRRLSEAPLRPCAREHWFFLCFRAKGRQAVNGRKGALSIFLNRYIYIICENHILRLIRVHVFSHCH